MRFWIAVIPLVLFAALAGVFLTNIGKDTSVVPSALLGKPAPISSCPHCQAVTADCHAPIFQKARYRF